MSDFRSKTRMVMDACKAAFGEDIVYTPVGLAARTIEAIVDEAFEAIDPNTGATIISNQPMIGVKLADLPSPPAKGDLAVVRGTSFRVVEAQTDGQAGTRLLLHKV